MPLTELIKIYSVDLYFLSFLSNQQVCVCVSASFEATKLSDPWPLNNKS